MGFFDWVRRAFGGGDLRPEKRPGEPPAESDDEDSLPEAYVVTDELDLHGFFPEQVPEMLDEFLENARRLGIGEVRIAHGKGKSVMRRVVWEFLEGHPLVAAYREAPPGRGGWGATIVRIAPEEESA
ncbi:MAG: Smr/MutS family protein [Candidatus Eisenbacteria bacterium]